jgi:hypothetical protein
MHCGDSIMAPALAGIPTGLEEMLSPERVGGWLRRGIRGLGELSGIGRLLNAGAPMSRRRKERIRSSLLEGGDSGMEWERQAVVSLPPTRDGCPVAFSEQLLEQAGFRSPDEAAASRADLPAGVLHCLEYTSCLHESGLLQPIPDDEFLRLALILGLCGKTHYDSHRPVIWTEGRLRRAVMLYQPRGFYED